MARMQHKSNNSSFAQSSIIHHPSDFYDIATEKNLLEHMYTNIGDNHSHSNRAQALKQIHLKNKMVKDLQNSTAIIFGSN